MKRPVGSISAAILLALLALASPALEAETADYRTPRFEVEVTRDLVYGVGLTAPEDRGPGSTELKLDVYEPRGHDASDKPAVVLVHGGAFVGGDKRDLGGVAQELTARGYVCFSISYRLMGLNPPEGRDAGLSDAQQAVRWVRHNAARYGVDPRKVAALGHSAGAFVVIGLAVADEDISLRRPDALDVFGTRDHSARINAAIPVAGRLSYADSFDPSDPPMMIVHAKDDPVVSFEGALALHEACEDNRIPCVLAVSESGGHDPWNADFDGRSLWDALADFLAATLVESPEQRPAPAGTPRAPMLQGGPLDEPPHTKAEPEALADDRRYTLTVTESAHGTAALDPPGGSYAPGTVVTLRATPNRGRLFVYWTGDIRSADAETTVVMDRDRTIAPGFIEDPAGDRYALDVNVDGPGDARVAPEQETYAIDAKVTLYAEPAPGAAFLGWRGATESKNPRAPLTMDGAQSATAVFKQVITAHPTEWAIPQEGGSITVRFSADDAEIQALPIWTAEWTPPWVEAAELATPGELLLAAAPNFSSYTRLCRIRFSGGDARPVHVVGVQPGVLPAAQPAEPGLAIYTGADGEWGTLAWHEPEAPQELLVLEPNMDGGLAVGAFRGAAVGFLSARAGEPLMIPDGERYDIHAAWTLPEDPLAFSDPADPGAGRPSYFYIGVDSGGVEFTKLRYGVEWKNIGNGPEWVLRGQRHIGETSAAAANGGRTPREIEVHIWKDPVGDADHGDQGGAAIFARFRLDGGPWQDYATEFGTSFVPVERLAYDVGDDLVTFKVRGLGSRHLHGLRVAGENVPGVNTGLGEPRP